MSDIAMKVPEEKKRDDPKKGRRSSISASSLGVQKDLTVRRAKLGAGPPKKKKKPQSSAGGDELG